MSTFENNMEDVFDIEVENKENKIEASKPVPKKEEKDQRKRELLKADAFFSIIGP